MQNRLDSNQNITQIQTRMQEILKSLEKLSRQEWYPTSAAELEKSEKLFHSLTRELGDLHTAIALQKSLDATKKQATAIAKQWNKTLKNKGLRKVNIRFFGGTEIPMIVAYYARNCENRSRRAKGCYPGLILLGIHDGCSSELASEISLACAALCSLEEAQQMLKNRGCQLNIKTIRNVMKRFSARARLSQQAGDYAFTIDLKTTGRRIVVSTDGGRIRTRRTKRGPKTKKNRNRYHTDWREPKLMIIYMVDKQGRADKEFFPMIDGAIGGGPGYVFQLIHSYLECLNITPEDKLLFVADGALWIWDRIEELKKSFNLAKEQVYELLDFYHAVEHLNQLAGLNLKWSEKQRKKWVQSQCSFLKSGKIDQVINAVKTACMDSKSKEIERERDYFIKNRCRLEYAKMVSLKFPMGSGAMESTIRRVVNLRLKSPGIFWSEESANEMILLRSYYKAKRWDCIKNMAFKGGVRAAA